MQRTSLDIYKMLARFVLVRVALCFSSELLGAVVAVTGRKLRANGSVSSGIPFPCSRISLLTLVLMLGSLANNGSLMVWMSVLI